MRVELAPRRVDPTAIMIGRGGDRQDRQGVCGGGEGG